MEDKRSGSRVFRHSQLMPFPEGIRSVSRMDNRLPLLLPTCPLIIHWRGLRLRGPHSGAPRLTRTRNQARFRSKIPAGNSRRRLDQRGKSPQTTAAPPAGKCKEENYWQNAD